MIRRRWRRRGLLGAASLALSSCTAPQTLLTRPHFGVPLHGVFYEPVPMVASTEDDLLPTLSASGGVIAYAGRVNGNLDIYTRPLGGGAPLRLTTHSTDDTDPAFSPDGKQLAWISQADDVKGDVWVMDAEGNKKRRLTGRDTADQAPFWSPSGQQVFFTCRAPGSPLRRIDALSLDKAATRHTVVQQGWDGTLSPDGSVLFYVNFDAQKQPRVFARRLADNAEVALTDGAAIEATPRAARAPDGSDGIIVVFARFVDDVNNDGVLDVDDAPSLWSMPFDPSRFDANAKIAPPAPRPLTAGEGGEIFASVLQDWLVYTAAGRGDLEIFALPLGGIIAPQAAAAAVLEAGRAAPEPGLRRLALRSLVASSPDLAGPAHYELARELTERGKLADAMLELEHAQALAGDTPLGWVAAVEHVRLQVLAQLHNRLLVREDGERRAVQESRDQIDALAAAHPNDPAVRARVQMTRAELAFALGQRGVAVDALEALLHSPNVPDEDGARALARLGEAYAGLGDFAAVARVSELSLRRFPKERYEAQRAAERWVQAAQDSVNGAPAAALEAIVSTQSDLPVVAARAAAALARWQRRAGQEAVALQSWQRIAATFGTEREVLVEALLAIGESAVAAGAQDAALGAYERLLAEFPEVPSLRAQARRGLTALALQEARQAEKRGARSAARQTYGRLLHSNPEMVLALRRYIALSAELGELQPLLQSYAQAAARTPRDKLARYAYGYALTLQAPVNLDGAQREMEAVLALEPRFTAAQLTLGWIRQMREPLEPGHGWLEQAAESFETARGLVDPLADPELWAAATLNKGNALFALGKLDDAFNTYLERELSSAAFESPLTEVLFRESFSRVALRVGQLDVALDMAYGARRLSDGLPNAPRASALAALLGALNLQSERYDDALRFYDEAVASYTQAADWPHVVPMLRGRALTLRALKRDPEALATFQRLLDILAQGHGPPPPPQGALITEIAANAQNITAGVYGFESLQEEDIARATAARIFRARVDYDTAKQFAIQHLALMRRLSNNARQGPRLRLELLYALHENALTAAGAGDMARAMALWSEALPMAAGDGHWPEVATLVESLQTLWLTKPESRSPALAEQAALFSQNGRTACGDDADLQRRFARLTALLETRAALQPLKPVTPGLPGLLQALEGSVLAHLRPALRAAAQTQDVGLQAHLNHWLGGAADSQPMVEMPSTPWRRYFDRALWDTPAGAGPNPVWLDKAWQAYSTSLPTASTPPEQPLFVDAVVRRLVQTGKVEQAWSFLEQSRLRGLQPSPERVGREDTARAWAALRASRDSNNPTAYAAALKTAPALLHALEANPLPAAQVRQALEGEAVLLQAFAPNPQVWHWFILDSQRLLHLETPPPGDSLPAAVRQALGAWPATLYVDAGTQLTAPAWALRTDSASLGSQVAVSEVLSATYLLAAYEARNLARDPPLALRSQDVPALQSAAPARSLFHLALPGRFSGPALGTTGTTQVVFGQVDAGTVIDLTLLQGLARDDNLALVDNLPSSSRVARAVAQSLLIAGIPTALLGDGGGSSAAALMPAAGGRIAAPQSRPLPPGMRLMGYRGMDAATQTQFAANEIYRLAKTGIGAYKAGKDSQDPAAWRRARDVFVRSLDTVAFLELPAIRQRLAQGPKEQQRLATPEAVTAVRLSNQSALADIYLALKDGAHATQLREAILATQQTLGKPPAIYDAILKLGRTLETSGRAQDAAARFTACTELAHSHGDAVPEALCYMALADARRDLFDYPGAQHALETAIALQEGATSNAQIVPRRQLGILFESQLNNYDRAQEQFTQALADARTHQATDMVPRLLIDLSRVARLRGDYAQALVFVEQARSLLDKAPPADRTSAALEAAKIYWYRGAYQRARVLDDEALAQAHAAGDLFSEVQARSLRGLIALNQGELQEAEGAIREALDLSRSIGRRSEEAAQLNNLGTVQREAGHLEEAVASFRAALRIDEALGSAEGRAYDLRNVAVAYARQQQLPEALSTVRQALSLSRSIGNRYNELQCLFAEGEMREASAADATQTQSRYEEAAKLARDIAVPEVEWRALYALGRLAQARQAMDSARQLYDQALAVAERLGRGRQESGAGVGHSRDDLYVDAAALAVRTQDLPRAHSIAERGRQRSLLDILASRAFDLPAPAKALLDAESQSREAVLTAQRAQSQGQGDPSALAQAEARHAQAQASLFAQAPRLARAMIPQPVPLQVLQAVLPAHTAVLSYLVGSQQSVALWIAGNAVEAKILPVGTATLQAAVDTLQVELRGFAPVETSLQALGDALLQPFAPTLQAARSMVLIPHGALFRLPFAALPRGDGPLWQHHLLSISLTAGHLKDSLERAPPGLAPSVTALAPSRDLVYAALEARAVAAPSNAWLGAEATRARLQSTHTDAIDIAAHGALNPRDPLGSALLLAPTSTDNGRLEVRQVFGWEGLPALVTLSACDTGSGASGAEWLGLGQAFLVAGAQQVVASQHRVSDLATGLLMKRFYRGLRHLPPAEALQQAGLSVRATYPHPAHWSGFILLGDPR